MFLLIDSRDIHIDPPYIITINKLLKGNMSFIVDARCPNYPTEKPSIKILRLGLLIVCEGLNSGHHSASADFRVLNPNDGNSERETHLASPCAICIHANAVCKLLKEGTDNNSLNLIPKDSVSVE
jgi:hypothetical protein